MSRSHGLVIVAVVCVCERISECFRPRTKSETLLQYISLFLSYRTLLSISKHNSVNMDRVMNGVRNLDHSLVFRIVNIIVGCFMVIGGVCTILTGGVRNTSFTCHCLLQQLTDCCCRFSTIYPRHLLHCFRRHGVSLWISAATHYRPARVLHVFVFGTRDM